MTDKMSDKEFIAYCKTHCLSPRSAFVPPQIARLLRLAGNEPAAQRFDAAPLQILDGYRQVVSDLVAAIEKKQQKQQP